MKPNRTDQEILRLAQARQIDEQAAAGKVWVAMRDNKRRTDALYVKGLQTGDDSVYGEYLDACAVREELINEWHRHSRGIVRFSNVASRAKVRLALAELARDESVW